MHILRLFMEGFYLSFFNHRSESHILRIIHFPSVCDIVGWERRHYSTLEGGRFAVNHSRLLDCYLLCKLF